MKAALVLISLALYSMPLAAQIHPCSPNCDKNWGVNGYSVCQSHLARGRGYCENACANKETPWVKAHPKETPKACHSQCLSDCGCCV